MCVALIDFATAAILRLTRSHCQWAARVCGDNRCGRSRPRCEMLGDASTPPEGTLRLLEDLRRTCRVYYGMGIPFGTQTLDFIH